MNETEFKKLRFTFLKNCFSLNRNIRIQDFERTKGKSNSNDLRHYLLYNILTNHRSYFTLINHDELLRYPLENDSVTEIRFDLDYKKSQDVKENIKQNIILGEKLSNTLKEKGLKGFFYYSGGKGVHCSFLVSTKGLGFKYNINDLDLSLLEKQFINKGGNLIDLLDSSNSERSEFKKCLYKWLNLPTDVYNVLDLQMCSSKTLLTLEGAKKRKAGAKFKTYLDYDKYNSSQLIEYVFSNYKPYIEFKFFNTIKELSEAQIEEIYSFKTISSQKKKPTQQKVLVNENINLNQEENILLITFFQLYKNKGLLEEKKTNDFCYYMARVLYVKVGEEKRIINILNKFLQLLNKKKLPSWTKNKYECAKRYSKNNKITFNYFDLISEEEFVFEYETNKKIINLTKKKNEN